jgi:DNA polymerase elongation subunit (family B)
LSDDRKSIYLNKPLERDLLEEYEISPKLPGAYVKEPIPGFYEWMFDLDLQSLYPSIIMTVNISPETKMFRILNWDADDLLNRVSKQFKVSVNGTVKTMNSDVMYAALIKNKYAIAANGVVYRTDVKGFIPTILERWFNERVEFKNLMKQYKKSGNEELVRFYNTRQMVMKVMLNSFYGVLALPTFRFYDVENAEAVTSTGQTIIKKTEVFANAYYESVIGQPGRYVKYVDTDSQFISSVPLVQHRFPDWETRGRQWMIEQTIGVADEVQKYINTCYSAYCVDYHNVTEHKLYIKQENVAIAGIWLAKKRYAQRVINEEGINVDKLDVKGMDIIRSDYPKAFKTILSDVINMILDKRTNEDINNFILDFKEKLRILPLNDIMFPTGVKGIEDYESKQLFACKKGTPAHVRSCINYNSLIKQLGIKGFGPIQSKDKIKWTYIVENTYFINCIALKGFDDPTEVTAFVQKHVDYDKVLETQFTSKIQQFWDALKWEMPSNNKLISTFFSF